MALISSCTFGVWRKTNVWACGGGHGERHKVYFQGSWWRKVLEFSQFRREKERRQQASFPFPDSQKSSCLLCLIGKMDGYYVKWPLKCREIVLNLGHPPTTTTHHHHPPPPTPNWHHPQTPVRNVPSHRKTNMFAFECTSLFALTRNPDLLWKMWSENLVKMKMKKIFGDQQFYFSHAHNNN